MYGIEIIAKIDEGAQKQKDGENTSKFLINAFSRFRHIDVLQIALNTMEHFEIIDKAVHSGIKVDSLIFISTDHNISLQWEHLW